MSGFDSTQSGEDFDWRRDADDIAIEEQLRIAVYCNPRGHVVIRQQDWPEDDSMVVVAPQNALALARAVLKAAGQIEALPELLGSPFEGASKGDRPKDPTAAERMRRYRERHRNGYGAADRNAGPLLIEEGNAAAHPVR
jgi:hypothetical protein